MLSERKPGSGLILGNLLRRAGCQEHVSHHAVLRRKVEKLIDRSILFLNYFERIVITAPNATGSKGSKIAGQCYPGPGAGLVWLLAVGGLVEAAVEKALFSEEEGLRRVEKELRSLMGHDSRLMCYLVVTAAGDDTTDVSR